MSDLKTKVNDGSVKDYLAGISNETRRKDAQEVLRLMKRVTRKKPRMWGDSIVGFGAYHYTYASGREGDWPVTGFSARKQNLVVYIMPGFERYKTLMTKLGKHKTGQSCLYITRLSDIDLKVLEEIVGRSIEDMKGITGWHVS